MHSRFPLPCLWGSNLEIRDGSNQSANFLGEFCGDYGIGVVRSSGQYMWLKFSRKYDHNFAAFYTGRANNETGMEFLSIYIYIYLINKICDYCSSWCKIGDELYSFVSRRCHYGCWSRRFDCNTASLHQAMRSIFYVSLFVARWFAAFGAFWSSLLFRLLDGVFLMGPYWSAAVLFEGDKFLKKLRCCVGGRVWQGNLILSTELKT